MAGNTPAGSIYTNIKLNHTSAVTSLKELRNAVASSSSAWRANVAELKSAGKAVEAAQSKYKGLSETVNKQKDVLNGLKAVHQRLVEAQNKVDTSTEKGKQTFKNYSEQIEKNNIQINRASTRLNSLTSQQEKAKRAMDYQASGLAKLQRDYRDITSVSRSYVEMLQSEGKNYQANEAKTNGYRSTISNLTKQYKIQQTELQRIAQESGKTSSAYRLQQTRVNETATSINKAKTAVSGLEAQNRRLNPSIWDKFKTKIKGVDSEAQHTHRTFKEVFAGSFLGNAVTNALSNIGSQFKSIYKDGMEFNAVQGKINSRFKNMRLSSGAIKQLDGQIKNLKYNTSMTGEQISDLQTKMLNWSTIGNKGAMQMTRMIAGVGDSSKLTGDQIAQMGKSLMRVGSTGKVTYSALTRVTKSAPTFMTQLAKGAGMSESKMKSLLRSGKVTQKQFQKWMAAAGKYSDTAFKGYGKTQGAALNRMKNSWMELKGTMMKPLFSAKTSGLQMLSKLLESKELKAGARAIGNGISKAIAVIYQHRKDVTGVARDFVSIGVTLAKGVWKDFSAIFVDIAKSFGLIHGNSKRSGSSLHSLRLAMDGLAKNKTAIQWISKAIVAMAAAKGISKVSSGIFGIAQSAYHGYDHLKSFSAGLKGIQDFRDMKGPERAFTHLGTTASKVLTGVKTGFGKLGKSASAAGSAMWNGLKTSWTKIKTGAVQTAQAIRNSFKNLISKTQLNSWKDLFNQKGGSGGLNGALQSMRSAGGFKGLSTAGKVATGAAAVGVAADAGANIYKAIKDKAGSKKQYEDIGKGAGSAIGGGIGLWFGGPLGAAIGSKIGSTVGKWAGDAAKKFQNGWNAKKPPKKFWSLENLGWSTHDTLKKIGKWGAGVGKATRNGLRNAQKGIGNFGKSLNKNTKKAMATASKAFKKGWDTIYKHSSKGTRQIMRGTAKFAKSYVKTNQKANKATIKNFSSFGSRLKKNHGNLFKTIGQTAKTQLGIEKKRWKGNFKAIHGLAVSWGKGLHSNMLATYRKLNKATHGGLGKVLNGFKSFGRNIWNFWHGLFTKISNFFKQTLGNINKGLSNVGKFFTGKLKVGSMHLAAGTDWRRRYPVPAILNDGNDSPETNNREGIIDGRTGLLSLLPNIANLRRFIMPWEDVVNARDMAGMMSVRHFASGTRRLGVSRLNAVKGVSITKINSELKLLTRQLRTVGKLAKKSLDFKFLKKNQKQLSKFTSTFKNLVKANKKLNKETKSSVKNFSSLTRKLTSATKATKRLYSAAKKAQFGTYIDKQARKAVKSLRGKGNFAKTFSKLTKQYRKNLKSFQSYHDHTWKEIWKKADHTFDRWTKTQLKTQKHFNSSFEKGWKQMGSGIEKIFSKTWSRMHTLTGKGMNAVIRVLNSGISRINSVVHQFGGSSSIHHVSGVHYANGTSGALKQTTFAIVNDGNDSPETGNKESFFNHNTGEFGIFPGRNTPVVVPAGVDIYKASDTRDFMHSLGIRHFANGTSSLHALYELTKKFYRNSTGTLKSMFGNAASGFKGTIRSINSGAQNVGEDNAQDWWTTLWRMVHNKIAEGAGNVSGFLKEAIKVSKGHRYVWGAHGPTVFDCSGLVQYVADKLGIPGLHQPSSSEYSAVQHISRSQARMNDLVFYGPHGDEHVGIVRDKNTYWSAHSPNSHPNIGWGRIDDAPAHPILFGRIRGYHDHGDKAKVKATTALQKFVRKSVGAGFWKTIQKIVEKYGDSFGSLAGFRINGSFRSKARALAGGLKKMDPRATRNGIIAILGNWAFESGQLNPGAVNPNGGASGFGQWLGGRKSMLMSYARRHHKSWKDPAVQLEFALHGDTGNTGIFRSILEGHGSVASLAAKFSRLWERGGYDASHVAGARAVAQALGSHYANGGIATRASIFGEAGPEMAIPLIPSKSTRAWELVGKAMAILSGNSGQLNGVDAQELKKQEKEDKEFKEKVLDALNLIANLLADTTIKTDVKIDGLTTWQAISKYAKREQRKSIINQRRGFSNGI